MPWTGIGVVFFIIKSEVVAQRQALGGAKDRNAVNLAPVCRDVFFKPPAQSAVKVKLTLFGVVVVVGIVARERVIAGAVQMGIFQRHGARRAVKIRCVEINHIGEHGIAPLFCVEGQKFSDGAAFAEGKEKILGIKTII